MKNCFSLFLVGILLIINQQIATSQDECARVGQYGSVDLCMPLIEGMKECYLRPNVKILADHFEDNRNMVLAYYVNDSTHLQVERLAEIKYEDYFKIYANKGLAEVAINVNYLESIYTEMSASFIKENWKTLKESVENKLDELEIGIPQLIEEFEASEHSKSMTLIINYNIEGEMHPVAMSINMLVINERLIFMAYYLGFKNKETFDHIKSKSKKIIARIEQTNQN